MISTEARQEITTWWKTSITTREPRSKAALARKIGCTVQTIDNIKKEKKISPEAELDELIDKLAAMDETQRVAFKLRVYQRAMEPKSSAKHMELYARLGEDGRILDKSEMKVKLSLDADELARINLEAERRAREFREGNRMENLQDRPSLLSEKVSEN